MTSFPVWRESSVIKYENDYWSPISKAVAQILHSNGTARMSFEQMYSIVYKCVCDGFAERLHSDLLEHCSRHLEQVDKSLDSILRFQYGNDENARLVMAFHEALGAYLIAVQHITPIFAYLNKFYVEVKLQTSVQAEVLDLFRLKVADRRIDKLIASVEVLLARPFALAPSAASTLFTNLHRLSRGNYGQRYPYLFARYVPNILPPMEECDIDKHIQEIAELQVQLRAQQGSECQSSRKRRGDDDNYGPTTLQAAAPTH